MPYKDNLNRDRFGYRTGLKILIRQKSPMSADGFLRWGVKQRVHIGKSKFVWKYYSSSRAMNMLDGIPVQYLKTDREFGIFLINYFYLGAGQTYTIQGWTHRRTSFGRGGRGVGFTKKIFEIQVYNPEKYAFKILSSTLNRYWFRTQENERKRRMWGE